jgi:antitoxin (DNA-binding transcriptional repressor) of toxin-antitoxin stability system
MIGIRELRTELTRHVRRAAAGERTVIAIGGRPAAALVPLTEMSSGLEPLLAAGALIAPRRTDPGGHDRAPIPVWSGARLDRLLRELRG